MCPSVLGAGLSLQATLDKTTMIFRAVHEVRSLVLLFHPKQTPNPEAHQCIRAGRSNTAATLLEVLRAEQLNLFSPPTHQHFLDLL